MFPTLKFIAFLGYPKTISFGEERKKLLKSGL